MVNHRQLVLGVRRTLERRDRTRRVLETVEALGAKEVRVKRRRFNGICLLDDDNRSRRAETTRSDINRQTDPNKTGHLVDGNHVNGHVVPDVIRRTYNTCWANWTQRTTLIGVNRRVMNAIKTGIHSWSAPPFVVNNVVKSEFMLNKNIASWFRVR